MTFWRMAGHLLDLCHSCVGQPMRAAITPNFCYRTSSDLGPGYLLHTAVSSFRSRAIQTKFRHTGISSNYINIEMRQFGNGARWQKNIWTFRQYGHKIFRQQSNKVMRQTAICKQQSLSGHSLKISSPCGLPPSMSASKHHSELPPPFLPDPNLCQIVSRHLLSTSLQVRMHSSWTPALDA